jgi:hypothetical protein
MIVRLTVLHTPDCPNAQPLLDELTALTSNMRGAEVEVIEVHDEGTAHELGFHGSPTLLVEGHDPFPYETGETGLACRLYRGLGLEPRGYPSREQLAKVLGVDVTE